MLTPTDLVGLWSVDFISSPGAQSDDVLLFFADGTGRFELYNPTLCNAWTFHWTITGEDTIRILGSQAYFLDEPLKVTTEDWAHDVIHAVSLEIKTVRRETVRVLRLNPHLIDGMSDRFGLCRSDVDKFAAPDFSWIERLFPS